MHVHERLDRVLVATGGRKVDVDIEWPEEWRVSVKNLVDVDSWHIYLLTRIMMAEKQFTMNVSTDAEGNHHLGLTWISEYGYCFISSYSCTDESC